MLLFIAGNGTRDKSEKEKIIELQVQTAYSEENKTSGGFFMYAQDGYVCLHIENVAVRFDPETADTIAKTIMELACRLREHPPKEDDK